MSKNIQKIFIVFLLICSSSSSAQELKKEKKNTFKKITEASFSPKRIGDISREDALVYSRVKDKFYNEQGVLIGYWNYSIVGAEVYQKYILSKNSEGKLTKSTVYDKDGVLKRYTTTKFDDNQNIIEENTYNSENKLTSLQKKEYDSKGNVVSSITTYVKSNKIYKTNNKYNLQNRLIQETDFKTDGSVRFVRTFVYDDNGNEIESKFTKPNGDYAKFFSKYDKNNNIVSKFKYDKEGEQKLWFTFSYVYDKNNNWVTKKRYSKGELSHVWERFIEYN